MSELAHGNLDGAPIHVGDQVMVSAEVLRSQAGVGALLRIYSKTDEMRVWVAEGHLRYVLADSDLPAEPPNDTWLLMHDTDGWARIFHRDDAEGHYDEDRRYQQHWFDVTGEGWIDWPSAVKRGAAFASRRRMVVLAEDQTELDIAALDEAMHTCWLEGRWEWMTKKMSLAAREAAAAAVERHHERIDPDEPVTTLRWWKE